MNYFEDEAYHLKTDPDERKQYVQSELKERFGIEVVEDGPREMICHARLDMGLTSIRGNNQVDVTIANSGMEAIAATLGHDSTGPTVDTENLIESILMDDRLAGKNIDLGLKFRETRHEQEFHSVTGGYRWVFQSLKEEEHVNADSVQQFTVSSALSGKLSRLNIIQQQHSRSLVELQSIQQQTFDDWHRYVHCLYPTEGTLDHFPEPDDLKEYIEAVALPRIKQLKQQSGVLHLLYGQQGEITGAGAEPDSLASELAEVINDLLNELKTGPKVGLLRVPGPRFQMAREPAVCLSGNPLRGLLYEQSNKMVFADFLVVKNSESELTARPEMIDNETASENMVLPVFRLEPTGSWNPVFLDWKIEYFPVEGEKKPVWKGDHYTDDYITSNFDLEANQPDLTLRSGKGLVERDPETLEGRSILDPFSRQMVRKKLLAWCQHQLKAAEEDSDLETFAQRVESDSPVRHQIKQVLQAIKTLDEVPMLTQSLSGLNQALRQWE